MHALGRVTAKVHTVDIAGEVAEGEDGESVITACLVTIPKFEVKISQIWGWERAQAQPELEGWTAPLTW